VKVSVSASGSTQSATVFGRYFSTSRSFMVYPLEVVLSDSIATQ
jgi:hypothetical protein